MGFCRNGENYNLAHGIENMRQPPPNWQELVGDRLPKKIFLGEELQAARGRTAGGGEPTEWNDQIGWRKLSPTMSTVYHDVEV